jgi:protein-S-isoprenylcysteine O-methyltransferase Ste14
MATKVKAILVVPPVIAVLITAFSVVGYMIVMLVGLPSRFGLPLVVRVLGGVVLLAGLSGLAWVFRFRKPVDVLVSTFLTMRKAITGTLTTDQSPGTERLVIEGPQQYVRHPMYFAVVVMVLGWWLVLDYTFILLLAGLMALWFNLIVIRLEEKELRVTFGEQYRAYSKKVPKFIPGVGRWRG